MQLGTFATRKGADDMLARLRESNILGARVVRTSHAETPFAVRLGSFVTYPAAVAEAERLKGVAEDGIVVP